LKRRENHERNEKEQEMMVMTRPIEEGIGSAKPGEKTNNTTTRALK
jgi:hypothetical protein